MRSLMMIPLLMLVGCAADDSPARQAALAAVDGKAIGDAVSCVRLIDVQDIKPVNDYVAMFHMRSNKVYRNDINGRCRRLGDDPFIHKTSTGDYCRGDIIQMFDQSSGIQGGSCVFGSFVPWELPAKDADTPGD